MMGEIYHSGYIILKYHVNNIYASVMLLYYNNMISLTISL